jgi:hypothetical protein
LWVDVVVHRRPTSSDDDPAIINVTFEALRLL